MRPEHRARWMRAMTEQGKLSEIQANKLIDAGYIGKRLREATDGELLVTKGIGQATVDKVRAWVGSGK